MDRYLTNLNSGGPPLFGSSSLSLSFSSPLVGSGRAFSSSFSCDRADNANTMTKRTAEICLVMMLLIYAKKEGIWKIDHDSRPRTSPQNHSKRGASAEASPFRLIRHLFHDDVLEPQYLTLLQKL